MDKIVMGHHWYCLTFAFLTCFVLPLVENAPWRPYKGSHDESKDSSRSSGEEIRDLNDFHKRLCAIWEDFTKCRGNPACHPYAVERLKLIVERMELSKLCKAL